MSPPSTYSGPAPSIRMRRASATPRALATGSSRSARESSASSLRATEMPARASGAAEGARRRPRRRARDRVVDACGDLPAVRCARELVGAQRQLGQVATGSAPSISILSSRARCSSTRRRSVRLAGARSGRRAEGSARVLEAERRHGFLRGRSAQLHARADRVKDACAIRARGVTISSRSRPATPPERHLRAQGRPDGWRAGAGGGREASARLSRSRCHDAQNGASGRGQRPGGKRQRPVGRRWRGEFRCEGSQVSSARDSRSS